MKRIALSISSEKHPNVVFLGYALYNEITDAALNFFSTVKFQPDEELQIRVANNSDPVTYEVTMTHLHEQISSGKIMNAIPDEEHPFPARTFYRCFAKVTKKISDSVPIEEAAAEETKKEEAAPTTDQTVDPAQAA